MHGVNTPSTAPPPPPLGMGVVLEYIEYDNNGVTFVVGQHDTILPCIYG